jgi:hypothetical protein
MNQIKKIAPLLIYSLFFSACIKTYQPELKSTDEHKYVISGNLTNREGYQYVTISKTSSLEDPSIVPVSNCSIAIIDNESNAYQMSEGTIGEYNVWMPQTALVAGRLYMLDIQTPEGDHIVSDYDELTAGGQIDSVFYERKDIPTAENVPYPYLKGIQFYLDTHGDDLSSRFYKWVLTETWEYHVDQPIIWWYDGTVHHVEPPDSSRMICWRTITSGNIYTESTENLSKNAYQKVPLSFVSNQTQRLKYKYSLLITQYSLSPRAYTYWQQMQINASQNGGLYASQPIAVKGNLRSLTNPEEEVLGLFYASSLYEKRIFVSNVENLENEAGGCDTLILRIGLREITPRDYPAYLPGNRIRYSVALLTEPCVDCLRQGGTTTKPSFWPN